MAFQSIISKRLVKSEDLNHHKTLFAGRCAEWFVESGFLAAASVLNPHFVVCLKIHGMEFLHPVRSGDVLTFESQLVYAGRSTMMVHIRVFDSKTPERSFCEGFATFVYVDENTVSRPHNLQIVAESAVEIALQAQALLVKSQK